jgi:hypothetical protein
VRHRPPRKAVSGDAADLAIVPMDSLIGFAKGPTDRGPANWRERAPYLARLSSEPIALIARRSVTDIRQLADRKVNVEMPDSATAASAAIVFSRRNIAPDMIHEPLPEALARLARGEIDAIFVVGGDDSRAPADFGKDSRRSLACSRLTDSSADPSLKHVTMPSIDLDADADAVRTSAAMNGKLVGATEEEIAAAAVAIRATLKHPILRRAAESAGKGHLRRETPILIRTEDGNLVEGVLDLAFREETPAFAGWTIVDFKTDREFAAASDEYSAQVTVYSEAVRATTGLDSQGILLIV